MLDSWTRRLRQFIEVARLHSISQAARSLGVSQQALSRSVADLESELGMPLLVRSPAGIRLTDFGTFFLKRAKMAVKASDLVRSSAVDYAESIDQSTILLGVNAYCLTDRGGSLSPAAIHGLKDIYPDTSFGFIEASPIAIRSRLLDGTLQFGIGELPNTQAFDWEELRNFPLAVVVSRENPVCEKVYVSPADLVTGEITIAADNPDLSNTLKRISKKAGIDLQFSTSHVVTVDPADSIVDHKMFVIMPEQHALRTVKKNGFAVLPLVDSDLERVSVDLCLMWRKDFPLGKAAKGLIDYVVSCYRGTRPDKSGEQNGPDRIIEMDEPPSAL